MKKKILVVDDDRVMLKFIIKLLSRDGHEVKTAEDGFAALNQLSTFMPEIIFFDLIMPALARCCSIESPFSSCQAALQADIAG